MKAIAVSIRADRQYIQAIKAIAAKHGKAIADLVYEAVEAQHGSEIQQQLSFFASIDYKNSQETKKSTGAA
jgi:hypothetical protein